MLAAVPAAPVPANPPPSAPDAAPIAAPSAPPKIAPIAAPIPAPTAALLSPLVADALPGVPPACSWANCLHVVSAEPNSSKLLPLPGNTSTVGPGGMLTQDASGNTANRGNNLNVF